MAKRNDKKYRLTRHEKALAIFHMSIGILCLLLAITMIVLGILDFVLWTRNLWLDVLLWGLGIVMTALSLVGIQSIATAISNYKIRREYEERRKHDGE